MPWRPIIEPGRVQAVLADVVAAIDGYVSSGAAARDDQADYAVLRGYLAENGAVADDDDAAGAALIAAIEDLASGNRLPGLYGGAARIGWTVAHLSGGDEADAVCAAIDEALIRQLDGWTGDYDLVSGLVGIGVYAVERGDAGEPIAQAVLAGLESYQAHGWVTPPRLLNKSQRAEAPDGLVNFGMAHGLPGVISWLAQLCRRGLEADRARRVLDSALARLLDANPPSARGRFAAWQPVGRPRVPTSTRLAWCYDDLGVAAALVAAGIALDDHAVRTEGLTVALDCAARSAADAQISDAGLCHGAAGIAHMFNRLAQATGEPALAAAAVRWIHNTLAMRSELPLAGFPANQLDGGVLRLMPNASLLEGACGVALALHAASSAIEPAWDRLLLVDMPAR